MFVGGRSFSLQVTTVSRICPTRLPVNQKLHPLLVPTFGNKYVDKYALRDANDGSLLNTSARVISKISIKLFLQLQF